MYMKYRFHIHIIPYTYILTPFLYTFSYPCSEARRLMVQGAVYLDGERVSGDDPLISPDSIPEAGIPVRIGRRRHVLLRKQAT